MRALRSVLLNLAVPDGRPSKYCDNTRPREGLHASAAAPATPGESMAASGSRKRPGSEQEADVERVVKKRVDLEPDSDSDVIVLSQPGTLSHELADSRPTSANTDRLLPIPRTVSLTRDAAAAKLCWTQLTVFSPTTFMQVPVPANAAAHSVSEVDDVIVSSLPRVLPAIHFHPYHV